MTQYCSVSDVSVELNGLSIDSNSTPNNVTVEEWITQESDILDKDTGRMWGSATITDEYHDYDGSGYIHTDKAPILSITSAAYEANGINATSENWVSLTEGRTSANDFIAYKTEGELKFHGTSKPVSGFQNFKISYVAGYATVNETARALTAKKVALRVIGSVVNGQSSEEGGSITVDVISLNDPTTFGLDRVNSLRSDIKKLTGILGSFKLYRYNRRWD